MRQKVGMGISSARQTGISSGRSHAAEMLPEAPINIAPAECVNSEPHLHLLPPGSGPGGFVIGAKASWPPGKRFHLFGSGGSGAAGNDNHEQHGENLGDGSDVEPVEFRAVGPKCEGED